MAHEIVQLDLFQDAMQCGLVILVPIAVFLLFNRLGGGEFGLFIVLTIVRTKVGGRSADIVAFVQVGGGIATGRRFIAYSSPFIL